MIRISYNNYDIEEENRVQMPNFSMDIEGFPEHIAYYIDLFRSFLVGIGYSIDNIDEYIIDVGYIPEFIKSKVEQDLENSTEETLKDSEEPADNEIPFPSKSEDKIVEGIKNSIRKGELDEILAHYGITVKPSKWSIEQWRDEFKRWMSERGAWENYVGANSSLNTLEELSFVLFVNIEDELDFISRAFSWGYDINGESYWGALDAKWRDHIANLKGEDLE